MNFRKVLSNGIFGLTLLNVSASVRAASEIKAEVLVEDEAVVAGDRGNAVTPTDEATSEAKLPTVPVNAEEASSTASRQEPERKSRFIEEIIVTAQKREENLQDVPISVNAFSAAVLDAKGISSADSLPSITPGLTINNLAGFSITYLRGVGSDAFLLADPSVATYIDGIYNPFTQGLSQDLGALERIEVLKGPQGTLFGRNAVGGAINVITKDPGQSPETSIQTSYASSNTLKTRVYTNLPISENLAASVSGVYNRTDGYYSGSINGKSIPDDRTTGFRLKLKWSPLENFDTTLAALHLELRGIGSYVAPTGEPSPVLGRALDIQPQTGYNAELDAPAYSSIDNTVYYGNAKLATDWFDVKVLGSYQHIVSSSLYDFDGSPHPYVSFNPDHFFGSIKTGELQILSNATSWGSEWLQWIVGGYYFNGRQGFTPIDLIAAETDLASNRVFGVTVPSSIIGLLEPLRLPDGRITVNGVLGTQSYSAFGQATAHLASWLALTAGGRFQSEKRTLEKSTAGLQSTDGSPVVNYFDFPQESKTTTSFKPKISIDVRPAEGTLIYVSYQQALKTGTYNAVNVLAPPAYVKPEGLTAYETGLKTTLFDGNTQLNVAAFQYTIKNLQSQFVSLLNGGAVSFENAGGSRIRGIDFDTATELFPSRFAGLVFTISGAYIPSAEYTRYINASGFDSTTGIYSDNNDFTGNRTIRTPKVSGNAGLSKTYDYDSGSLELATDVVYNSGFAYLAQGCALAYVCESSYYTLNARASYFYQPWGLRITVFGNNLTDQKYTNSKFITDFGAEWYLAPPVTYGLRLNWDF